MVSISKIIKLRAVRVFGLVLVVFVALAIMSAMEVDQTLENHALDLCYRLRPPSPSPKDIVIIGIDEQSFQDLRTAWPWPRRFHAELIGLLKNAGARLIVFDVLFAEPSDSQDDKLFAEAIKEAGNVILASAVERSENQRMQRQIMVQPLEPFRQAALGVGLALVTPDRDGLVRRFSLRFNESKTLPEIVASYYYPGLPLPSDFYSYINFTGPPGNIRTISYSSLMKHPDPALLSSLRGKIVLIGRIIEAAPTPMADTFYTPFFASTGKLMSGVEIHGQIIQTLLKGNWGQELGLLPRLLLSLLVLLLFGCLVLRVSPYSAIVVLMGFILLIFGLSFFLFLSKRLWVPPVFLCGGLAAIYAGHIFAHFWLESREKRWLRQAFGQYVSDSVVEAIIASPGRLQLGGEEVEATVLFADLVGFSSLAEHTAPRELIHLLNEYFSEMTEIILAHRGTVDKFIGDAIMAFWGAPLSLTDHAVLASKAALQMQTTMGELTEFCEAQGFHYLPTARIGIHSGPVIAGNVGSKRRFNYTVMGDAVNLAARLEEANKIYGTGIIMSEATRRRLVNHFLVRELDLVQVRGRAQPVTIYELISLIPPEGPPLWVQLFEAGRTAFRAGNIPVAANHFSEILRLRDDPASKLFLERCQQHLNTPVFIDWKAPFILEGKY